MGGLLDLLSWLLPVVSPGFFMFPGLEPETLSQYFNERVSTEAHMFINYWAYKLTGMQRVDQIFGTDLGSHLYLYGSSAVDSDIIDEAVKHYPNPQMSTGGGFIPYGSVGLNVDDYRGGNLPAIIVAPSDNLPGVRVIPSQTPGVESGVSVPAGLTNSFCPPTMCQPAGQSPLGQGKDVNQVEDLFTAWDYLKRPVTIMSLATMLYALRLKIWKEGEDYSSE